MAIKAKKKATKKTVRKKTPPKKSVRKKAPARKAPAKKKAARKPAAKKAPAKKTAMVKPKKSGRPTKYNPVLHPDSAFQLCELGATDAQMARIMHISESTLSLWKLKHKEFSEALKEGKNIADTNVERSLYARACGFSATETKILASDGIPLRVQYEKHYPPDTTACIFWLKNRRPDKWRDKVELAGSKEEPLHLTLNLAGDPNKQKGN